jgi:hypothetical protein
MSFQHVDGLGYVPDYYAADCPVGVARDAYFQRYGLGDGGYNDDWVHLKAGYIPVAFPNTPARKRNIGAHDLHHLATGCNAVWNQGEIDVSAYEIRTGGCGTFVFGWVLILNAFTLGLFVRPGAMFRCFVQSRGARNLFQRQVGRRFDGMTIAELRRYLRILDAPRQAAADDVFQFAMWGVLALAMTAASVAGPLALLVTLVRALIA